MPSRKAFLVTFAVMALCCDNSVRDHEMGYHQGGGTAYITAKGVMRRTGLSRTAAARALQRLGSSGRAPNPAPAENLIHAGGSRCEGVADVADVVRDGGRWGVRVTGNAVAW